MRKRSRSPLRLGDILVSQRRIEPHQLTIALSVQQRLHLPLGRILVENNLISRRQLHLALFRQKLLRIFGLEGQVPLPQAHRTRRAVLDTQSRILTETEKAQRSQLAGNL